MLPYEILQARLVNQHLATARVSDVGLLVGQLGAVQSQDYGAANWALGQRLCQATAEAVQQMFNDGAILRTHVLRPTWHFVAPADLRWMLSLTAPRVKKAMAGSDRLLGLDDSLLARSNAAIARALEGGQHLTRPELGAALRQVGIQPRDGQTLAHIVFHAELDLVVCSGAMRGKQQTYALVDQRVPSARSFDRDSALGELTARYFTSHGPATLRDFVWWSGLTVGDGRRGLELNGARLVQVVVDGLTYWFSAATPPQRSTEAAYLLPNFDEYTVAYRDRDLFYAPGLGWVSASRADVAFGNVVVVTGRVVGMWKRTLSAQRLRLDVRWFAEPSDSQRAAVLAAAERLGRFLGLALEWCG